MGISVIRMGINMEMDIKRKKNIALFTPMLENEFSASVLEGAQKGAAEADVNLIVFPMWLIYPVFVEEKVTKFRYQYNTLTSFLESNSIDGVIIEYGTIVSTTNIENKRKFLKQIKGIPTILLAEDAQGYNSIVVDNSGLYEILEHIYSVHECTKIALISGPCNNQDAEERLAVYKNFVSEKELNLDDSWIAYGDFSAQSEFAVEDLLKTHPDVEAIICANDHMAISVYNFMEKRGLVPGKDILVTGFDNIPTSELLEPALTTVDANTEGLGYDAVMQLVGKKETQKKSFVHSKKVVRNSCGCRYDAFNKKNQWDNANSKNNKEDLIDNRGKKNQVKEGDKKKVIEVELGNIMREMVYAQNNDSEWFMSVLNTFKNLGFEAEYIMLYEESVKHENHKEWISPQKAQLKAYYDSDNQIVYDNHEHILVIDDIFNNPIIVKEDRFDMIVVPLFFRTNLFGFLMVKGDYKLFQVIYQIASQISSSLYNISVLKTQELIKEELAKASQSKSLFLANMSHEIRTPINAITGMTEMILRESDNENIINYANNIESASKSLLSIVNDILDFSKIEANKMTLVDVEYRLKSLIDDAVTLISMKADEKKLKLETYYDSDLPAVVYGDNLRIGQILLNILSNAVKYTKEGSVKLSLTGRTEGENAILHFSVADTGIGIKKENIAKLFENFERFDEKRNRNIEGTGLGMSITVALLKLMGSKLEVQSVYNEGSIFSFELSQKIIDSTPIDEYEKNNAQKSNKDKKASKYTAPSASILVVDDIEMNRVVISCLLAQSEIRVVEASGGIEAIEKYKNDDFDIILLDHMMPQMDGEETLYEIHKLDKYIERKTPIVALTANAISGEKEKYLAMGFDAYIAKPVEPDVLDTLILQYLPKDKVILT